MLSVLAIQFMELSGWAVLWFITRQNKVRQYLIHGRDKSVRTPVLDTQLQKFTGHPSKLYKNLSRRIVLVIRKVVNTRAFELGVLGLCNPNSPIHKQFFPKKKMNPIHII